MLLGALFMATVATCTSKVPNRTPGANGVADGGPVGNGGVSAVGGAGGGSAMGGAPTSMGPRCGTLPAQDRCDVCLVGMCCAQIEACLSTPTCSALKDCYDGCAEQSCYEMCDQTHAAGLDLFNQAVDCQDTKCGAPCNSSPEDPSPPDAGAVPPSRDAGTVAFPAALVGHWDNVSSEIATGYQFTAQGRFIYTFLYDNNGYCVGLGGIAISMEGNARVEGDVLTMIPTGGTHVSSDCSGNTTPKPVDLSPIVRRYRIVPGARPVLELTYDQGTSRYTKR